MRLTIGYTKYQSNDALAVTLACDDGSPYATLSVNVEGVSEKLASDEFVMKSYSENERVAGLVLLHDIFEFTGRIANVGFNKCPIMRVRAKRPTTMEV